MEPYLRSDEIAYKASKNRIILILDAEINHEEVEFMALVVESRVRDLLPEGIRLGGDAVDGLDEIVKELVKKAVVRCQANGRKTVRKEDF